MQKLFSFVAAGALMSFATMAIAQSAPQPPITTPQSKSPAKCTPGETDLINMQLKALKGMQSSVGQTAKDFCAALDKTEEQAAKEDNGLIGDVLALLKKHGGADIDIKTISKMCKANEDVPTKALEEQIAALEKAKLACQDSI